MIRKYPAVVVVVHTHGHNDGCAPIAYHLRQKYVSLMAGGSLLSSFWRTPAERIADAAARRRAETLILEAGYPASSHGIVAAAQIPPQSVTHVLALVDAQTFELDPSGDFLRTFAQRNGVTAVGLGNVGRFDRASRGKTRLEDCGMRTKGLVEFVERVCRLPVPYLATDFETCIDREPYPIHEEPDPTTVVHYGADPDALQASESDDSDA